MRAHNKLSSTEVALARKGARRLFELVERESIAMSDAAVARAFGVERSTVARWRERQRIGAPFFARVEWIPKLRSRVSPGTLRPDMLLPKRRAQYERAVADAAAWAAHRARPTERMRTSKAARLYNAADAWWRTEC